jgi:hypothetical protein
MRLYIYRKRRIDVALLTSRVQQLADTTWVYKKLCGVVACVPYQMCDMVFETDRGHRIEEVVSFANKKCLALGHTSENLDCCDEADCEVQLGTKRVTHEMAEHNQYDWGCFLSSNELEHLSEYEVLCIYHYS